jgi:hypothetical protein
VREQCVLRGFFTACRGTDRFAVSSYTGSAQEVIQVGLRDPDPTSDFAISAFVGPEEVTRSIWRDPKMFGELLERVLLFEFHLGVIRVWLELSGFPLGTRRLTLLETPDISPGGGLWTWKRSSQRPICN